jgi:flagellar hook-basal body complex protein FliE
MPIDPSFAVTGPDWNVGGVAPLGDAGGGADAAAGSSGSGGFGDLLAQQISNLEQSQVQAAEASRALATGTATDLPSVVNAVEHARLSMELASQIRNKAVEAYQEIFRTQV